MQPQVLIDGDQQRAFLLVKHGGWTCALSVSQVSEVFRPLPVEAIAGAPAGVLGLSLVRGQPVPVVELGRILGAGRGALGRFVVLNLGARKAVLGVESVLGIRLLDVEGIQDMPPLLREANPEVITAIASLDRTLLVILETARLVPSSCWEALDAREQAQP